MYRGPGKRGAKRRQGFGADSAGYPPLVAELTSTQEKLAEALGLALAAEIATEKVEERVDDPALVDTLRAMRREARETQARIVGVAGRYEDEACWEIQAHAAYVQRKAGEMASAWFKAATDGIQACQFLAMGEAGEIATWAALAELNGQWDPAIVELCAWAIPIQERHLKDAFEGVVRLAALPLPQQESLA